MARIAKIATTSLATLEDTAPPFNLRHPDPADTLPLGLSLLDAAGAQGADLALLPEGFMAAGLPAARIPEVAEPLDGPVVQGRRGAGAAASDVRRRRLLREGRRPHLEPRGADRPHRPRSSAPIRKQPSDRGRDRQRRRRRADRCRVFETDFGRVGLAICFDLNWPDSGRGMKRRRAPSWSAGSPPMKAGCPLQAYAWMHQYADRHLGLALPCAGHRARPAGSWRRPRAGAASPSTISTSTSGSSTPTASTS